MKALLAPAAATALFVVLVSCQQPYKDTAAESSAGGPPAATLSAPSFGPGDAPPIAATPPKASLISITSSDLTTVGNMASQVAAMVSSVASFSSSGTSTTAPGTGLSGYTLANGSWTITTTQGTFLSSSAGSQTIQTFEETSPDYTAYLAQSPVLFKTFPKAFHALDRLTETDSVNYSSGAYTIAGTRSWKTHGEWFEDTSVANGAISSYTIVGISEAALGCAVTVVYNTNSVDASGKTIYVAGKFVVSQAASSSFVLNTGNSLVQGNNTATVTVTVTAYDLSNQLIGIYNPPTPTTASYTCYNTGPL